MSLRPEESKALLALPAALDRLTRVVILAARWQRQASRRYLTAKDVAREFGFKSAASVWAMPEVMAERIYPTVSSTPRWTVEGLARAVAKMPNEPRGVGRKAGMRDAA